MMPSFYLEMFGVSLLITLAVEIGLAALIRIRGRSLLIVLLVNTLTNPIAVFISYYFSLGWAGKLILESVVVVIEGLIYYLFGKREGFRIKRPFLVSLLLNAVSFGSGLLIRNLL